MVVAADMRTLSCSSDVASMFSRAAASTYCDVTSCVASVSECRVPFARFTRRSMVRRMSTKEPPGTLSTSRACGWPPGVLRVSDSTRPPTAATSDSSCTVTNASKVNE